MDMQKMKTIYMCIYIYICVIKYPRRRSGWHGLMRTPWKTFARQFSGSALFTLETWRFMLHFTSRASTHIHTTALAGTRQLCSQGSGSVHAHCTEGVTRSDGREGANGDGSGNEGGNGGEDGDGNDDGDGDGAGTGPGEEVKERRQDGNGNMSGDGTGAGTGTGAETRGRTLDGKGGGKGDGIGDGKETRMEREGGRRRALVSATSGNMQSTRPGTAISRAASSV